MRIAAVVALVLLLVFCALLLVPIEPQERRPGARLGGEVSSAPIPRLAPRQLILVETQPWHLIPHSVTTTAFFRAGKLYVPCRGCDQKRWPKNVAANPDVRLKVGELIYERRAIRIDDDDERRALLGVASGDPLPDVAVFRMDAR